MVIKVYLRLVAEDYNAVVLETTFDLRFWAEWPLLWDKKFIIFCIRVISFITYFCTWRCGQFLSYYNSEWMKKWNCEFSNSWNDRFSIFHYNYGYDHVSLPSLLKCDAFIPFLLYQNQQWSQRFMVFLWSMVSLPFPVIGQYLACFSR